MTCFHQPGLETAFAIDPSSIVFGPGVLSELGQQAKALGCRRVALFTDATVAKLIHVATGLASLAAAGIDVILYTEVHVEPTSVSFMNAAEFARQGRFDGYVSIGGGSVIDTCKAAALYATYPAELQAYVNVPVGDGQPVPGPLPPHIACPTTCGTGSECTGIAVFDHLDLKVKTGIASRRLRPTLALIDPTCTETLPSTVVAASGFDVLCHALESYTARPYTMRTHTDVRPMSQGRNPWSDMGSLQALRLAGACFLRAVADASDTEARHALSWAATLAGIAFGNAGVHLPHAMAYSVAGRVKDYRCEGYPQAEPLVPHGISVIVNAPSVFRFTAATCPERHLEAAAALGADIRDAAPTILADTVIHLMRAAKVPPGVGALGYDVADIPALATGAYMQKRLVDNAPLALSIDDMQALFRAALRYA